MSWPKNENINEMYEMYLKGFSLAKVAEFYGKTRQSVFGIFKYNKLEMRGKKELDFLIFNGGKYTIRNTGYYARTDQKRTLLHRDMWEFYYGEIPCGYDVHHIDENKLNNVIENFECLPKSDHTKLHYENKRKREKCGS